jgi:hypothetical protein
VADLGGRPTVSGAFAELLAAHREGLNLRWRATRAALPRLDQVDVLGFIAGTLGPIAAALPADRAGPLVERLLELALPLLARGLLGRGAYTPQIQQGWELLLPRWPHLLEQQPERLVRAVSNALHALGRQPGARPEEWIAVMAPLGAQAGTLDELLELGKVVAWRCGMAQYRVGALSTAAGLPPVLAGAALGAPGPWDRSRLDDLLARLRADPWEDPATAADARPSARTLRVFTAGAFRGLGGPFVAPPRVALQDGALVASDPEASYRLWADRCGQALLRRRAPGREAASGGARLPASWGGSGAETVRLDRDGGLAWGPLRGRFPVLAEASEAVFTGHTLAVAHPLSHSVLLVARIAGAAP